MTTQVRMAPSRTEVADGIHRLGDRYVNWYVLEDGGRLTVIDAGLPGHWEQLASLLTTIGRTVGDIVVVLLTHRHPDHLGCAQQIRQAAAARVLIHGDDADGARRGGVGPPVTPGMARLWLRPVFVRYVMALSRAGGAHIPPITEVATFADGERLDVPGHPRVIHAPGHTPGECVLHIEERDVVFAGDALVTLDPSTGHVGPSVLGAPFTEDRATAFASLERIGATGAGILLPGHGEPWREGVAEAVRLAQHH
jgi:glyoxylase-like metal-dependent hydrolase (beta-lactamase superfamily II)